MFRLVMTRCLGRPNLSMSSSSRSPSIPQQLTGLLRLSNDARSNTTSSSTSSSRKTGSSAGRLAALALGGAVTGVILQQLLIHPAARPPARDTDPVSTGRPEPDAELPTTASPAASAPLATTQEAPQQQQQQQQQQQGSIPADLAVLGVTQELPRPALKAGELLGPWVQDAEMELVVHRRAVTKNRLMAYINSMQQRMYQMAEEAQMMGKRGEAWFQERMKELEAVVDLQAQIILFGVDEPNARRKHLEQFGCSKWTDEALDVIKGFSPLVEIGAGHGHWQRALAQKGVDVLAFDNESSLPMEGMPNVGQVQKGNEAELRKHRRRTLLLVYPGPDDMGSACLKEYKGDYLLYVGERRGGVNGTPEFFDMLEAGWEVEKIAPLDPFPDGYEKLFVLRRKGAKGKGKSWWRR